MKTYITGSSAGITLRMNRLFNNKDKFFLLPLDHGVNLGPAKGLDIRKSTILAVDNGVDAIMIRPSMVKDIYDISMKNTSIIMALTGKFDRRIDHLQFNTVEYAIQCGADAVCTEFKFGSDGDLENSCISSRVAEEAHKFGLPNMITVYVLKEQLDRMGNKAYAHACRIAEELGADIIKIALPDDPEVLKQCIDTVSIPIIAAGGSKILEDELIAKVKNYIDVGISGVAMGRNIWGSDNSDYILKKIIDIIH